MIRLDKISRSNIRECLALKVREDQRKWVLPVSHCLAMAYVYGDEAVPFAIYRLDTIIGFVMLRYGADCDRYLLWQFMIDERFQSKGYGKSALRSVVDWVNKGSNYWEIVVTYQDGNEIAGRLYREFGFIEMDQTDDGEINLLYTIK